MSFNKSTKNTAGKHAFLSPSTYHWLEYDEDKMRRVWRQRQATLRGDALHDYAQKAIALGVLQADNGTTLSSYINDAIRYRMTPEVPLYYSDNCFGTTDAIGFKPHVLRIHDLKTGVTPADMKQLKIYAALFCFEYSFDPMTLEFILRIYQNDQIEELNADPTEILWVMDRIKTQDKIITYLSEEDL